MTPAVRQSMENLKRAFAHRRKPRAVPHCQMCYRDAEIESFLALPIDTLGARDLRPILRDGYICWGTWTETAYYLPRLLELYAEDDIVETDRLFALILYPLRPEVGFWSGAPRQLSDLVDDEREAIAAFLGEVVIAHMAAESPHDCVWRITQALTFLAGFPHPIAPLLERISTHEIPQVRANFALFLTDCVIGCDWMQCIAMPNITPSAENQTAIDRLLSSSTVAHYLLDHADDIAIFGPSRAADAALAFDWAMSQRKSNGKRE